MHALSDASLTGQDGRWGDFWVRTISAAILGPIALFCLWHGGIAWLIFILGAAIGLGLEWLGLAALRARRGAVVLTIAAMCFSVSFARDDVAIALLILVMSAVLVGARYGMFAGLGIPYAGLGGIALVWLRLQPHHGLADTLFLVATIWGTDSGAYVTGRILGGRKMAPKISPGKTWSGAVGGLVVGGLAGGVLAAHGHGLDAAALPAALLLSVFGQAGDLLESAIKRRLGVKDSGQTIPGHGGLFDRLDGFLVAAPVAAILALSVQGGVPLWG